MHCVVTKIPVCVCVGAWGLRYRGHQGEVCICRRYMSKVLLMEKASWSVQKEHIITHTLWGACVCMCVCAHTSVCAAVAGWWDLVIGSTGLWINSLLGAGFSFVYTLAICMCHCMRRSVSGNIWPKWTSLEPAVTQTDLGACYLPD